MPPTGRVWLQSPPPYTRRWCPVHDVSALDERVCWVEGCGAKTIPDPEWRKTELQRNMKAMGLRFYGVDPGGLRG